MIELFNKRYKSISNLFITTIEEDRWVFPCPLSAYGTLENAEKHTANELELRFSSYFDSPLTIDSAFQLTFYALTPFYVIEVITIQDLLKKEDGLDTYGYKGKFIFQDGSLSMNLLEEDIYSKYKQFEKQYKEQESNV